MSILWKNDFARNSLHFNNLQNKRVEGFSTIRFLEGHIQLSKAPFALKTAGLDHLGTYEKRV